MGPNVQGNRPADEMRTEDQSMCRRVRLTVMLGPAGNYLSNMTANTQRCYVSVEGLRQGSAAIAISDACGALDSLQQPLLEPGESGFFGEQREIGQAMMVWKGYGAA